MKQTYNNYSYPIRDNAKKPLIDDAQKSKLVPSLVPADCSHLETDLFRGVDEEFQAPLRKIHGHIFSKLITFDSEEVSRFEFKLPETFIPKKGVLAIYEVEKRKFEAENLSTRSLSGAQVKEVFRKGSFSVKSQKYNQDYIWQLSTFLVKGYTRTFESFQKDISWVFYNLYQIKKR